MHGHSTEILKRLSKDGMLIGIDRDTEALNAAKEKLKEYSNVTYIHGNHDEINRILDELNVEEVDGILLDLGVSSYQLDEKSRGFSYLGDNPLDMRMNKEDKISAKEIVNNYQEEELTKIFWEYGEEKYSRQIARNICKKRDEKTIETTKELVEIIENTIPKSKQKYGHPAKRVFQAIRIEVNNELEPLYNTVINSVKKLRIGGRLAVITFHSLEDRIVKKAMVDLQGKCTCPPGLPYCICNYESWGKIINKKPIISKEEELEENSRAKSAKLRIFERKNKE